jgi:LacI family transcriptional regulator
VARPTIVDVARAAGVMPSTVSKALNSGRGSAEVRRRVEAAAAALGYRPNQRARGLRRSESRSIGVLVPDLANPVFLPFLRGAEHAARERGYTVLIADGERSDSVQAAALERFFDQGVDGLLLGGPVAPYALALYREHGVAVVPSGSVADRDADLRWEGGEAAATRVMAERLVELGHRRFAFVGTPIPARSSARKSSGRGYDRSRLGAFAAVVDAAPDGAELVVRTVDPTAGSDAATDELVGLFTGSVTPTAVVCGNHLLAPWLLMALAAARRRIPNDVSVVVYGDSDWARAFRPALSVVCHDTYAEGVDFMTSLLDAIAGVAPTARPVIAASYVERASCGRAPGTATGRSRARS